MRKAMTILLFLFLLSFSSVFAETIDTKAYEMKIGGYIDDIFYLDVTPHPFISTESPNGKGINLDFTDPSNTGINRYLITPTETPLTDAGLEIGSFNIFVTFQNNLSGATLTLTHTQLIHTEKPTVKVDYELAAKYRLSDGDSIHSPETAICYSTDSILTSDATKKGIRIDLSSSHGACVIRDGSIYFRLTRSSEFTVDGQYASTITFVLEAK